jgi:hypothetical protein
VRRGPAAPLINFHATWENRTAAARTRLNAPRHGRRELWTKNFMFPDWFCVKIRDRIHDRPNLDRIVMDFVGSGRNRQVGDVRKKRNVCMNE